MKLLKIVCLVLIANASAYAQITTAWTVNLPSRYIPTGFTVPNVPALTGNVLQVNFVIDVPADSVMHAVDSTALHLIGDYIKDDIDSNYVEAVWGLDPDLNITGRILITNILRMTDSFNPGDFRRQYKQGNAIFRVRGKFQWKINIIP